MNDNDAKLMYKRMADLNINIIQLGKDINSLRKTQDNLLKKFDTLPKEVFKAASQVSSKTTPEDLKPLLREIIMTTDDTQKTVDNIFQTFTKEKARE
ncbi:MAG: hypothetical protein U9P44_02685 [archaeon]|nr:hypothetical protein [archaeon]